MSGGAGLTGVAEPRRVEMAWSIGAGCGRGGGGVIGFTVGEGRGGGTGMLTSGGG